MKQWDRPFEERVREDRADCIYDRFVDAIVTGHRKSGAKLLTMQRLAEENGVTFRVARGVVERLGREGYVKSYPHRGTIVRAKKHTVWRGRVLFVSFDDDSSSYFVTRIADALRRRLVAEGYLMTPVVASRAPRGSGEGAPATPTAHFADIRLWGELSVEMTRLRQSRPRGTTPIGVALASVRENLIPMFVLWSLAGAFVFVYYAVPGGAAVFGPLRDWQTAGGW